MFFTHISRFLRKKKWNLRKKIKLFLAICKLTIFLCPFCRVFVCFYTKIYADYGLYEFFSVTLRRKVFYSS